MTLPGSSRAEVVGLDPLPGVSHYYPGPDPKTWRHVPRFSRIRMKGVYPGIDLVFHGENGSLEYDFVVAPGADPDRIRVAWDRPLRLGAGGELAADTALGPLRQLKPRAYQESEGGRREIASSYRIEDGSAAFQLARYDRTAEIVIDPVVVWSSVIGGSGADAASSVAVDSAGAAYLAGFTRSTNFPVRAQVQSALAGSVTAFAMKFDPAGAIEWSTFLGSESVATGIAVDSAGAAYVTGYASGSFPTVNASQPSIAGANDGFLAKIAPSGGAIVFATMLGGQSEDFPSGVSLDAASNAYIAGITHSVDMPAVNPFQRNGAPAGFVAKFLAGGTQIGYATRLVFPEAAFSGIGFTVDRNGAAYIVGRATSGITTTGGYQTTVKGGTDAFLVKFNPHSTGNLTQAYGTYIGGSGDDYATDVAQFGDGGEMAITGSTSSTDFPTKQPYQAALAGNADGFAAKLSTVSLITSTYLGGASGDFPAKVLYAANRELFVAGTTQSSAFAPQSANLYGGGASDGFLARLNESGSSLAYSLYVGGEASDSVYGLALDGSGVAFVAGQTDSGNFPQVESLFSRSGPSDAFLTRVSPCTSAAVSPRQLGVAAAGGALTTAFAGDSACPWTATTNSSWISFTSAVSGTGPANISMNAAANSGPERRGAVTIGGIGVTVNQASGLPVGTGGIDAPSIVAPAPNQIVPVPGVTISWTQPAGAAAYDLRIFGSSALAPVFSGTLAGAASTTTLVTLADGEYVAAVRGCGAALTDASCGAFATSRFTVNATAPARGPTIEQPAAGVRFTTSTQSFSWTAVPGAERYEVLLEDVAAGLTELQISTTALSTTYSLRTSTNYRLRARGCSAACGPYSSAVTFSAAIATIVTGQNATLPRITPAPTISGGNNLTVSFTEVPDADFYRVQVVQPAPAGPGGGALTVAAVTTTAQPVTLPVPAGAASVFVFGCTGNGCGGASTAANVNVPGPNPSVPVLGSPVNGQTVTGPSMLFTWNRVPGDTGSTVYRLYVQDLSRQAAALDVLTTQNFYGALLRGDGVRYDAVVIANPFGSAAQGPSTGFNVRGASASAPTMVSPTHNSTVAAGNVQLGWSPVSGATSYQYFVAVSGVSTPTVTGVTPGLLVQVPLPGTAGAATVYSGIVRACPAGAQCAAGSDAGWGPWSNAGGGGVTNFTIPAQ